MSLFDAVGFSWDRSAVSAAPPVHSRERACFHFHKMEAQFIWDAGHLEGCPFTFPEVQTLLAGIPLEGRAHDDQQHIFNLGAGGRRLLSLVKTGHFAVTTPVFVELQRIVTRDPASRPDLTEDQAFRTGVAALETCPPFERALAFFLFGVRQQFFPRGTQYVSCLMMNGILMANGIDAISIPAARARDCHEKMARFQRSGVATEMMEFLLDCHLGGCHP